MKLLTFLSLAFVLASVSMTEACWGQPAWTRRGYKPPKPVLSIDFIDNDESAPSSECKANYTQNRRLKNKNLTSELNTEQFTKIIESLIHSIPKPVDIRIGKERYSPSWEDGSKRLQFSKQFLKVCGVVLNEKSSGNSLTAYLTFPKVKADFSKINCTKETASFHALCNMEITLENLEVELNVKISSKGSPLKVKGASIRKTSVGGITALVGTKHDPDDTNDFEFEKGDEGWERVMDWIGFQKPKDSKFNHFLKNLAKLIVE